MMARKSRESTSEWVPGRKPGPAQRDEFLRIWDMVDDDGRKLMLFFSRTVAREQGLVAPGTPLVMTARVV
jgi:hypothetical protein